MLSLKRRQQTLQQQAEESRTAAEQLENLRGLGTIWMSCGVWTMSASATAGCPGRPLTAFR